MPRIVNVVPQTMTAERQPTRRMAVADVPRPKAAMATRSPQRETSPDIAFTGLDGSTHQLDEYKDRYVILVFFAQWCPICAKELPSLQQFAKDPAPRNTVVVPVEAAGAAVDLVQAFQTRLTPGMPLFYDTSMKAANAFKVEHFPTTYLLTPDLVAREMLLGAVNPGYMGGRLKLYGGG